MTSNPLTTYVSSNGARIFLLQFRNQSPLVVQEYTSDPEGGSVVPVSRVAFCEWADTAQVVLPNWLYAVLGFVLGWLACWATL